MEAVATAAVGGAGGAVLGGQSVVAGEEGFYAVGGEVIFGVELFGGVTLAANVLGDFERGAFTQCLDFVLGMTISACGSVAAAGGDCLAVDAFDDVFGLLLMALAAGLGEVGEIERRLGGIRRQDGMGAVAVGTGGGMVRAGRDAVAAGCGMNAGGVSEGRLDVAAGAIHRLGGEMVVGMLVGDVVVATGAGVGAMDGGGECCGINEKGEHAAGGVGGSEGFVAVAIETIAVADFGGGKGRSSEKA